MSNNDNHPPPSQTGATKTMEWRKNEEESDKEMKLRWIFVLWNDDDDDDAATKSIH